MITLKLSFVLIINMAGYLKPGQGCAPKISEETTTIVTVKKPYDAVDTNLPHAWGGFELPESLKTKWKDWLKEYQERMKQQDEEGDEKYKKDRGPGSGWPLSWQGIGGGHGGDPPPPWAYQPINTGLPEYCYQPPVRGACPDVPVQIRWAFNPYLDDCVEFEYVCRGNQNNFDTQERCMKMCMVEPVIGCDVDTNIYIDDL